MIVSLPVIVMTSAGAADYVNKTIVGTMSREQSATFAQTFKTALDQAPDGGSVSLKLPDPESARTIEGKISVPKTKTDHGSRCRQVRTELRRGAEKEHWAGWYCLEANGEWKRRSTPQ
jgi:surface antigen